MAVDSIDRPPERLNVGEWVEAERGGRAGILDDDLVAKALDERPGDARRHRGDQVHPVGREPRCEHRDRDHQPTEAAEASVRPHHVAVREDVGPADLDDPSHLRVVERADEVVEHVGDADRLATGPHPAGRDHDRQALGQVAQDLERRATGSDDHRRPELGDGNAMCGELGTGLVAAGEVVGEVCGIVTQTPEVDDPRHAGTLGRLGEVAGCLPVAIRESPFTRAHRVRQVVGDVDPLERHWQRRGVEEVGSDDRRVREPGGEGPRVAAHQDELVSSRREKRDEPTADVAARANNEDPHDVSCRDLRQEPLDHGRSLVPLLQLREVAGVLDRDPFQVAVRGDERFCGRGVGEARMIPEEEECRVREPLVGAPPLEDR